LFNSQRWNNFYGAKDPQHLLSPCHHMTIEVKKKGVLCKSETKMVQDHSIVTITLNHF